MKKTNNTIAFVWYHRNMGKGIGIWLDDNSQTVLEDNILLYCQTIGVLNPASPDTALINNIFFQCQGGIYKYIDRYTKLNDVLIWRTEDLELLNSYPDIFQLSDAEGNLKINPNLNSDREYLLNLINNWSNNPINTTPELIEEWRRNLIYLSGEQDDTENSKSGMAYNLNNVIPDLVFDGQQGVQIDIDFPVYNSETD